MSGQARWYDRDLAGRALRVFVSECETRHHELCGGNGSCLELLAELQRSRDVVQRSRRFDARRETLTRQGEVPTSEWSTTALIRTTLDLILTPPSENWIWRSIVITSALARLGERGLSPDAILRTGLGKDLTRRVLLASAAFLAAEQSSDLKREEIPSFLDGWCDLLAAEQAQNQEPAPPVLAALSLSPEAANTVEEWLSHAAVGHLLGWRINDYLVVDRCADDMVFLGGVDATIWVCDRLARTFLTEWKGTSLQWELAYCRAPVETAIRAGVDPAILAERTCTEDMVVTELSGRLSRPGHRDEVDHRVTAEDLIPSLALMLKQGNLAAALAQARRAYQAYPAEPALALAYAFCCIPEDRAEARRVLEHLRTDRAETRSLVAANLAVCALFDGCPGDAIDRAEQIVDVKHADTMWLWDPEEASQGRAAVRLELLQDWLPRLRAVAQST